MIRFIDIRNQGTGYRFAFFNTVTGRFISIIGDEAWDNFNDVENSCSSHLEQMKISRYKSLCPEWAFDKEEDNLEDWIAGEGNNENL